MFMQSKDKSFNIMTTDKKEIEKLKEMGYTEHPNPKRVIEDEAKRQFEDIVFELKGIKEKIADFNFTIRNFYCKAHCNFWEEERCLHFNCPVLKEYRTIDLAYYDVLCKSIENR